MSSLKKALITGGTRGIGKSIVEELKKKYTVYYTGKKYRNIKNYFQLDLSDTKSVNCFIKDSSKLNFDILVNNAGINNIKHFDTFSSKEIQEMLNINLINLILITKVLLKNMIKNNWGRIINISSIWGVNPCKKRSIYSITKSALISFSKSLAIEYGRYNINSNSISPGFILTDLTKKSLSLNQLKSLKKKVPLQRFGSPKEIAEIVLFLCREKNYINGSNIVADGGFLSGYEI
jgi:3-oxoacyl-[acyl-carrier protein] reductase